MNRNRYALMRLGCFAAAFLLAGLGQAQVTVSGNPANGATGVSTSAPVVLTFSGPVDTNQTTASFYSSSPFAELPVVSAWNSSSNQLTCTPSPGFPASQTIIWEVAGQDAVGNPVSGDGYFTTGSGGGSGSTGSGTNAITTFGVSKIYLWDESAAGVLTNLGCSFYGTTILASNRTDTNITLTLPTAAVTNLTPMLLHPETNYFYEDIASSNTFETTFPQGTYTFNVEATTSNQTVQVVLPASMTQPNPPYITNIVAAQSVNATQSFVIYWQAFVGGTITDYVNVSISDTNGDNIWQTPDPTTAGALKGTATSVTIPANTLQANSNYVGYVGFYHLAGVSNANYLTAATRIAGTEFPISTVGTIAPLPVVTNIAWSAGSFSFDVLTTTGQTLTVVSSTNCALPLAQWPVLLTTNSPGVRVHVTDTRPATSRGMVYRVRNGM